MKYFTAMIDSNAVIGERVSIGPYCVIGPDVVIEDDCKIWSHTVIGTPGEMHPSKRTDETKGVIIRSGTEIREFVTINAGVKRDTVIGENCYIMAHCHVGHDAVLQNDVTMSTHAIVGGHSLLMHHANMGLGSITHQFTTLGQYCMIAAGAAVVKDIIPLGKFIPGKSLAINNYAIDKYGLLSEESLPKNPRWEEIWWRQEYCDLIKYFDLMRDKSREIYSKGVW